MAAVTFELDACPHCRSDAEVREHPVYRYQCRACGSPRIPVNRHWLTTPPSATHHLEAVRRHHIRRGLWQWVSWASWFVTAIGAFFAFGAAWSLDFTLAGWLFVSVLVALPLVLAIVARLSAARNERQSVSRLDDAWRETAAYFFTHVTDNDHAGRGLDQVKEAFRVDSDTALRLLAEGEVASYLDSGLQTQDAVAPNPLPRVRVAPVRDGRFEAEPAVEPDEEAAGSSHPSKASSRT